ncbi:MAG: patatin-like phospholipase family protein [Bacillota bacterium]
MNNVGLVLEGGGMRGQFTAGALDFFLDKGIEFGYIIGVSAGACNATSFISRQKGRNKIVNTAFINDWRFASFRNLILKGSLFGMDFIFDEIPNRLVYFDFDSFFKDPEIFRVVATDCNTGKAVYFDKTEFDRKFSALRASCSLPLVSPMVDFLGYKLLDGGVADPVPIRKAMADGCHKNVIILTRNKGYRKEHAKLSEQILYRLKYRKYPKLVKALLNKPEIYNEAMCYIEDLEQKEQAVVIRPTRKLSVDRYEKDPDRLLDLYHQGYEDAAASLDKIKSLYEYKSLL